MSTSLEQRDRSAMADRDIAASRDSSSTVQFRIGLANRRAKPRTPATGAT